ncbi:MAG: thiol oxidoreductase [Rhodobacteraceae bacterium]|nr:thiol oxidoreductase [Paracoccaceae bacterium]
MKNTSLFVNILAAGILLPAAIFAQDTAWADLGLTDLQLDLLPRTDAETARIAAITALTTDFSQGERFEGLPAGGATVRVRPNANAFSIPSENIGLEGRMEFALGNGFFRKLWVSSPASTISSDGLGPLYNARGCQTCHIKDGRGHPPAPGEQAVSMFLRLSVPAEYHVAMDEIAGYIATAPDPTYGGQLQNFTLPGIPAEGRMVISYAPVSVALSDGRSIELRAPSYSIENPGYGAFAQDLMISPRVTPQMIGLGMLEAIPVADILALADPNDADGDGISGRPNIVLSDALGVPMLGRFGYKAGQPSVLEQSAGAFAGDMGLSSALHPAPGGDCTANQPQCLEMPNGADPNDGVEVAIGSLDLVAFYSRNLGVPARRGFEDEMVLRGKEIFYAVGCTSCHNPKFVTGRTVESSAQSFQLIWPYTDMLLHDMGDGLADNRPEGRATGTEWRTAPLWGIGLVQQVSPQAGFLHDGRARTLLEAVLWHGGEAQVARDRVVDMPAEDRAALIQFLESL